MPAGNCIKYSRAPSCGHPTLWTPHCCGHFSVRPVCFPSVDISLLWTLLVQPSGVHIPIGHYFMVAICFWEATFSYKSYHLSDCYRLHISCKNNIGKAQNNQTDLSDWYQLYISCKINIEISITLSKRYEIFRSIFYKTDDGYSCNHAKWVTEPMWQNWGKLQVKLEFSIQNSETGVLPGGRFYCIAFQLYLNQTMQPILIDRHSYICCSD